MKKFKVYASYVSYVEATIEAESLEQAIDEAREMDGGDFKQTGLGDWSIDEVFEETN